MNLIGWMIVGAGLVVLYAWYAAIVKRRNRVGEALAGIDVQLQQRHDLIPNVLVIARRFMEHEQTLLSNITELRSKAHQQIGERDFTKIEGKFETEARLEQQMGRLLMLSEKLLLTAGINADRSSANSDDRSARSRPYDPRCTPVSAISR